MAPEVHTSFKDIVLHGQREELGMASFADLLSEEQVDDIYAHLLKISHEAYNAQQSGE